MDHSAQDRLLQLLTIREAAEALGLQESSLRRMIADGQLQAQFATQEQIFLLLQQGRIKGVPGTGVRLIPRDVVALASQRPKRGRHSQTMSRQ